MRFFTLSILFVFNCCLANAQTDSVNFKHVEWQTKRLAPGIKLKQAWFRGKSLFNADEFISVIEVKERHANQFLIAYEPKTKITTSNFAKRENAIAAVNGTFFDVKNGGSVDFIKAKGQIINENRLEKDNTRARHQQAALVIKNGKLHIEKWDGSADWEKKLDGEDVMLTGPLLLYNQQAVALDANVFNKTRHPRSAIAVTNNHRILLITVDGRDANSAGMSLFELRKVLQWMHCNSGVNLDGGGSTTLWEKEDGVVNHPADNNKWDHEGQRRVANVVLVARK